MALPLLALIPLVTPLIKKLIGKIPDKDKQKKLEKELESELLKIVDAGIKGQLAINQQQAKHKSVFVAGARPYIMWVCGFGMTFQYVLHPMLIWVWAFFGIKGLPPPVMDMSSMMPLLMGMLGLGGMRSYDKMKGVQTDRIKT